MAVATHGDDDDLTLAGRLLQLQPLLHGVRVEVGDDKLARAVEALRRRVDAPTGGSVRDCFYAHSDLHAAVTLAS